MNQMYNLDAEILFLKKLALHNSFSGGENKSNPKQVWFYFCENYGVQGNNYIRREPPLSAITAYTKIVKLDAKWLKEISRIAKSSGSLQIQSEVYLGSQVVGWPRGKALPPDEWDLA